ncbi:LEM domain-containing protein 1 [Myotis lucifugus]|uniref:LEM domain-containing protein 1 n=1 Tax=Myotis lucifugus TaxID=59463 RepID=UPI0003C4B785|nr:LEM domain-containing protein 1 [Myotis lucifugus]
MVDVKCLSDYELQNELNKLGFSPGPILCMGIIVLKGNIILSSEKKKGPQKALRSGSYPRRPIGALGQVCEMNRWASGAPYPRFREWNNTKEKADCTVNGSAGSRNLERFPVGLTLAVFGIFIIVVFVYITVEKKPLFG